jgi:hypothetical protein
VSAPSSPLVALPSWVEAIRVLGRVILIHLRSGRIAWRWGLLTLMFAASSLFVENLLSSRFFNTEVPRKVDAWDLFPGLFVVVHSLYFVVAFGFLLFIVDTYHRERDQGTATLSISRIPSRSLYWLGTMGAVGATAVAFVGLAWVVTLLVGLVIAPPASAWPLLPRESVPVMYPPDAMPLLVSDLLLMAYSAFSLWVVGCAVVLLSLFVRRKAVMLGVIFLWVLTGFSTFDMHGVPRYLHIINVGHYIGIYKHRLEDPYPAPLFFGVSGLALVLMAVVGSWRLRREEL